MVFTHKTDFPPVLTRNVHRVGSERIQIYLDHGGYQAARKALRMEPGEVIEQVRHSRLRGRGGAGFPTGVKWGYLPRESDTPKIIAVNTDEGEPGTFKDREIVEQDPHQVIEGVLIARLCGGARTEHMFISGGNFFLGVKRWDQSHRRCL